MKKKTESPSMAGRKGVESACCMWTPILKIEPKLSSEREEKSEIAASFSRPAGSCEPTSLNDSGEV